MVQSETMATAFNKALEKRYRDPPGVDATARDFLGLKCDCEVETAKADCGKALTDLGGKAGGPRVPRRRCASSGTDPGPATR